jgi:hypothetical protein
MDKPPDLMTEEVLEIARTFAKIAWEDDEEKQKEYVNEFMRKHKESVLHSQDDCGMSV